MNRNAHYWVNKQQRANTAVTHTAKMEHHFKNEIEDCIKKTKTYNSKMNFSVSPKKDFMKIEVVDMDSVSAIFQYAENNTAVLNFASYKNPGGMFINGSKAQEECLCHESFLYNVLKENQNYYDWNNQHKNRALYLNRALYSPNIKFFHEDKELYCDVITCASPNKSTAQKYQNVSDEENKKVLASRIDFVLKIAMNNHVDTLILGAYGCGVFGQNPREVAELFKEYLNKYHCFSKVIFAIPNGKNDKNLSVFKDIFS